MVDKKKKQTLAKRVGLENILEFLDGPKFDFILEKITIFMFRIIIFVGVPYFLYILKDFY